MSDCLTDEQFEGLTAHRLPESETVRLNEHVRTCTACQQTLEEWREDLSFAQELKGAIRPASHPGGLIQQYLDDPKAAYLTDTVPGYELVHELHRGTQGVVYQAVQTATDRQVAIKFLREGVHASRSTRKRFEREIELVGGLEHPNIIRVFESGVSSTGHHYYVMDFVRGLPLHRHVWHGDYSLEQTLRLFTQVCDAVICAHQHGVIHRDLKPSNVLVDAEGVPHVLDFGLARPVMRSGRTWASMTGEVVGTLPYMSPEQARGGHGEVDTRSDVYSLGVMLYQMTTGEYPYPVVGPIAEVLNHIADSEPVPPRRRWSAQGGGVRRSERQSRRTGPCPIDEEIETIILRALAKDPSRRYQNVDTLRQDIQRYLDGEPIEAKRDAGLHVLRRSLARYKVAVVATALAVVLACVGAVVIWNMYSTQLRLRQQAEFARRRALDDQVRYAEARTKMGDDALDRGDAAEARAHYQMALALNQDLAAARSDSFGRQCVLAESYLKLGDTDAYERNWTQAEEHFRTFRKIMSQLVGALPQHPGFNDRLATGDARIADVLVQQGRNDEAEVLAKEAIRLRRSLIGGEDKFNGPALEACARLLLTCSVVHLREPKPALEMAEKAMGVTRQKTLELLSTLALAYHRNGQPEKARQALQEALKLVPDGKLELHRRIELIFDSDSAAGGAERTPASRPAPTTGGSP